MENHHVIHDINGKTPYKWSFSIAMLVYQRVQGFDPCFDDGTSTPVEGPKPWLISCVELCGTIPKNTPPKSWIEKLETWKILEMYHMGLDLKMLG